MFAQLFSHLINTITEKRCAYCEGIYSSSQLNSSLYALCPSCSSELERYTKSYCKNCGKIPPQEKSAQLLSTCLHCADKKIPWSHLAFYALYDDMLQDIIKKSKFNNKIIFTRTLADLIAPLFKEFPPFDFIVPMPLHKVRLQERGYNQCLEIIKYINKKYYYPYNAKALTKIKHTVAQSTLSQAQRKVNLQSAFKANESIVKNKTILLFDDVSTTGSTLMWASKALKKAGAKDVYVAYIAATKWDYS